MKSIVKFHREIQKVFAWAKYFELINFRNNYIKEKNPIILLLKEIEALRSNKLQGERQNRPHPDTDA